MWAAGEIRDTVAFGAGSRLTHRTTTNGTGLPAKTWYAFGSSSYNFVDELLGYTTTEPGASSRVFTNQYSTDGTRRLTQAASTVAATSTDAYFYDVFGNRVKQTFSSGTSGDNKDYSGPSCAVNDTLSYTLDNRLVKRRRSGCNLAFTYFNDHGNNLIRPRTLNSNGIVSHFILAERGIASDWLRTREAIIRRRFSCKCLADSSRGSLHAHPPVY